MARLNGLPILPALAVLALTHAPVCLACQDRITDQIVHEASVGNGAALTRLLKSSQVPRAVKNEALQCAAWKGQVPTVRILLDHGADVNCVSDGETVLYQAARRDNLALASLLIKRGARVRADKSALMVASSWCHTRVLALLMRHGANVNCKDENGETPLMAAAGSDIGTSDRVATMRLLLAHHADVHARDNRRNTPLWYAHKAGNHDAISTLKHAGAKG